MKRFPVIYFLHGLPASEDALLDTKQCVVLCLSANIPMPKDFPEKGFTGWVNELVDVKGLRECIIVMPNAANRYGLSFYTNSVVQGNYEDYITNELIAYIDFNFRTYPHRDFRAIMGHSGGGYGALKLAMKHPDIFGHVVSLSASIFTAETVLALAQYMLMEQPMSGDLQPTTPYEPGDFYKFATNTMYGAAAAWLPNPDKPPCYIDLPFSYDINNQPVLDNFQMERWNANNLLSLVNSNETGLKKLESIYIDCGINDELNMYQPNLALHKQLDEMNISHFFELHEGTHFNHLFERVEKALLHLSNEFPY